MKEFLQRLGRRMTGRKGIGDTMTVAIIIAVIMLNILAYTVTNAFGLYLYSPNVDDLSISGNTDALFAKAIEQERKVKITFCYTEDQLKNHDTGSYVLETAHYLKERYPTLIELKFVSLLTKMDENGVIFNFDKYLEDGKYNLNQSSVIFETGEGENWSYRVMTDNATSAGFVNFFTLDSSSNITAYNGEEVMAAMISWVLADEHPVAYFTQNHGETADVAFTNLLTCAGYYIEVKDLRKEEIPSDAGMVIISNPTQDFGKSDDPKVRDEIDKIADYLNGGGKLYVTLDPYGKKLNNLETLLGEWGITVSGSESKDGVFVRHIVKEDVNAITTDGYTFIATLANEGLGASMLNKIEMYGHNSVLVREINRLELDASLGAKPVLVSGSTSSLHAGGQQINDDGGYTLAAYSTKTGENGKESMVFVMPSAYITAADALLSENYSNKDFLYAVFEVLFDSHTAPRGCNTVTYKTQILENLTMGKAKAYTAVVLAIPVALAVTGIVITTRRKNR